MRYIRLLLFSLAMAFSGFVLSYCVSEMVAWFLPTVSPLLVATISSGLLLIGLLIGYVVYRKELE